MNIEPGMLCVVRVPDDAPTTRHRCLNCGVPFASIRNGLDGVLCVTVTRDVGFYNPSIGTVPGWFVESDNGLRKPCCGGLPFIPEFWLHPLPPPPITLHHEQEATA